MRTDVTVDTDAKLRCQSLHSPGLSCWPSDVGRGDFIEWQWRGSRFHGRIIGVIADPKEDGRQWLAVVMMMLGGCCCGRWVDPADVIDSHRPAFAAYREKAQWFYGDEFLETPPDVARDCFNLTCEQMAAKSNNTVDAPAPSVR